MSRPSLGQVSLEPAAPVVAGSMGTWTITLTVGAAGIDEGGTIKLAHRFASDWQVPQFAYPAAAGFTTVSTTSEATLRVRYDTKGGIRPWMKAIVIDVTEGSLAPGDLVRIVLGDRTRGSPGTRAQTFAESAHEFGVFVDPTNACLARRVPGCPTVPIVAGSPVALVCCVPTQADPGRPVPIHVGARDAWGNPTPLPAAARLRWQGSGSVDVGRDGLVFRRPGSGRVWAETSFGQACSNPVTARPEPPRYAKYWGDLHAQTGATLGTGTEVEYFTFGRDAARLDFMSHQGNDFQMTDEDWLRLNAVVPTFHEDHRFVVFPGYEWSANTPAGGDRNVFYRRENLPIIRSSHWQVPEVPEDAMTPASPAPELFRRLRQHVPLPDVIVGSHVGGRYADIPGAMDAELAPLVEVMSCWGIFEWLLWDALAGGHRVGVMCNSDGHKGRPGAESPGDGEFGIAGGLTCVLAEALTRDAVFAALKARRCYGTTGPRIDLDLTVNGRLMGEVLPATDRLRITASARGVGPMERLQLLCGPEVVHEVRAPEWASLAASDRLRLTWGGSRRRGRGRRAVWDGRVSLDGTSLVRAQTFAFDSPSDGIQAQDPGQVTFRSRTTGDCDGLDLWLRNARRGQLAFESPLGTLAVDLAKLDDLPFVRRLGGLDLFASLQRYPARVDTPDLALEFDVAARDLPARALLVKAIQADGHAAWSSPVYLEG